MDGKCHKIQYRSRKAAKLHVKQIQKTGETKHPGKLHEYWCSKCLSWHVGHQVHSNEQIDLLRKQKRLKEEQRQQRLMEGQRMIYVQYEGFIIKKTDSAIGLSTKKFGNADDVEVWLPRSRIGEITYKTGGDSRDVFVNEPIEAVEMEEWLARDRGLI